MKVKRWMPWLTAALAMVALSTAASGSARTDARLGPATSAKPAATAFSAGLVSDVGRFNDRGFNQLALKGLNQAKAQLKIKTRAIESRSAQDYIPNLSALSRQRYNIVIGVGFLMADAINTASTSFGTTKFALVDFPNVALKDKPKNERGLIFKEEQAGCLVGYLAALQVQAQGGRKVISSVGGQKIPPVDHFIAGYQFCAKLAVKGITTLNGYSQDFVDQGKCKEVALNQIAQGSQVVFQVAGGCGLGALDAAKQKKKWGIGVDADQAYLGKHMLTSAKKNVDVAVFQVIKQAKNGTFKGGADTTFTVKNGGVGYGKVSSKVSPKIIAKVEALKKRIAAGKVKIPNTVK